MSVFVVIDAARDYALLHLARLIASRHESLFSGPRGERLAHVAPHLLHSGSPSRLTQLVLGEERLDGLAIVLESSEPFEVVRHHLRRFLLVESLKKNRPVFFRYYDPRVLRAFLPACMATELDQFFGPITAFHCQAEEQRRVITFRRRMDRLETENTPFEDWRHAHYVDNIPGEPTSPPLPASEPDSKRRDPSRQSLRTS